LNFVLALLAAGFSQEDAWPFLRFRFDDARGNLLLSLMEAAKGTSTVVVPHDRMGYARWKRSRAPRGEVPMSSQRQVAVIVASQKAYHRKILRGIGAYVHEVGDWSLYIEEEPLHKLPDLSNWQGDGIILSFFDRNLAKAACKPKLPMVGIEGRGPCYDPAWRIPSFDTDDVTIGRMGAQHLIERGFTRLAFCGYPSSPLTPWSVERGAGFQQCAQERGLPCAIHTGRRTTVRKWIDIQHELTVWLESLEKAARADGRE
jgi:LacI family transcriptional regulator